MRAIAESVDSEILSATTSTWWALSTFTTSSMRADFVRQEDGELPDERSPNFRGGLGQIERHVGAMRGADRRGRNYVTVPVFSANEFAIVVATVTT